MKTKKSIYIKRLFAFFCINNFFKF